MNNKNLKMGPAKKETNSKKWKGPDLEGIDNTHNDSGANAIDVAEAVCCFCRSPEQNEAKLGKKYVKNGVCVHYFCMLFASGLSQRGRTDNDGILGFLIPDINKEARRSGRLKCTYCKQPNATIGCVRPNCRSCFHFGCGIDNGTLNQFFGNFCSFCAEHRPFQVVPLAEQKQFTSKFTLCIICMNNVHAEPGVGSLRTSCCKANSWYHKDCLQRMATCSGLHFFKCPLCNNKDGFQKEMLEFGIYIPDRDAAWELEPNAYQDLLVRHDRCDIEPCQCPLGTKHNEADSYWELILCDWCGHQGCHLRCGGLTSPDEDWVCKQCVELCKNAETPFLQQHLPVKKKKYRKALNGNGQKRKLSTDEPERHKRIRLSESTQSASPIRSWGSPQTPGESNNQLRRGRLSLVKTPCKTPGVDGAVTGSVKKTYVQRDLSYYMLGAGKSRPSPQNTDKPPIVSLVSPSLATSTSTKQRDKDSGVESGTEKSAPTWLRDPLNGDPAHSQSYIKYIGFPQPTDNHTVTCQASSSSEPQQKRRRPPSRKSSTASNEEELPEGAERPRWLKNLLKEDYITGRNLGRKLSEESPGLKLYPGMTCHLQSTDERPKEEAPSDSTDVQSASPPGDHQESKAIGSIQLLNQDASGGGDGGGDVQPTEVKEEKEADSGEVADGRQTMGYFTFIQHLESIGYHRQHTVIERLSLYQQYKDGEFQLLTFADIKPNTELIDNTVSDSPTPSLVSPNEVLDASVESETSLQSSQEAAQNPSSSCPSAAAAAGSPGESVAPVPNLTTTVLDMPGSPDIFDGADIAQSNTGKDLMNSQSETPPPETQTAEHIEPVVIDSASTTKTNHDHNDIVVQPEEPESQTTPVIAPEQTEPQAGTDSLMPTGPENGPSEGGLQISEVDPTLDGPTSIEAPIESDGSLPSLGTPRANSPTEDLVSNPETPSQTENKDSPPASEGGEERLVTLPTAPVESSPSDPTDTITTPAPLPTASEEGPEETSNALKTVPAAGQENPISLHDPKADLETQPVLPGNTTVAAGLECEQTPIENPPVADPMDVDVPALSAPQSKTPEGTTTQVETVASSENSERVPSAGENVTEDTATPLSSEQPTTDAPVSTEHPTNLDDSIEIDDADAEVISLPSEEPEDWSFTGNSVSPDPEVSFRIRDPEAQTPTKTSDDSERTRSAPGTPDVGNSKPLKDTEAKTRILAKEAGRADTPDPEVSFRSVSAETPSSAPPDDDDDDDDLIITGSTPPDPNLFKTKEKGTKTPTKDKPTEITVTEIPTPTKAHLAGRRAKVLSLTRSTPRRRASDEVIITGVSKPGSEDPSDKENADSLHIQLEEIPTVRPSEAMVDLTEDNNDVVIVELVSNEKCKRCNNCGLLKRKHKAEKKRLKELRKLEQHPPIVEID